MNRTALPSRLAKRRVARKPRIDAETVFKTFVRTLERLREPPRGGSAFDAIREKA